MFGERCDVTRKLGPCSPALHPRTDGTLRERTLNSFKPQEGPVPPCLHQSPRWPACCGALGWPGGLPGGNRQEDHRCPQTGLIRCPQSGLSIDDGLAHRIWKGALRTNFALGGGAAATESTICSQIALPLADGALVYRSAPRFGPTRGHRRPCWRPPVEVGPGKPQTQAEPLLDILQLRRTFFYRCPLSLSIWGRVWVSQTVLRNLPMLLPHPSRHRTCFRSDIAAAKTATGTG